MNLPRLFASVVFAAAIASEARAQTSEPAASVECGTDNLVTGKLPSQREDAQGDPALATDGAVSAQGTRWDAPTTVILGPAGSVTYDLGSVRDVSAFYVQADSNDTYQILGSRDGTPGSFMRIAEVQNVLSQGDGLRDRTIRIPPASVRYLRLGEGKGDGFYSVAEFAAYCRAPSPFPPPMRVIADPVAQEKQRGARAPAEGPAPDSGRSMLLVLAAGLALIGLIHALTKGDKGKKAPEAAQEWSIDDQLRVLFLASGCAALIYEVVWLHLLRLVIGASALSVGIVLASFMGGMFLGSLFFARFVPPERSPLRVYAVLEIGIGVFGLLMPIVLPAVRYVYVELFGYGPFGIALRAAIAGILLLPPTALMGATLPAIARRYTHGRRGMSRLAGLYAANTIGAVCGSLLSAFYLLAQWDVWIATFAAAALNLAVGAYAFRLAKAPDTGEAAARAPAALAPARPSGETARSEAVYLAIGLSGLTALGAQVIWTRVLTLLFGATVYAFAIILAVFLSGLGIGSALAAYLLRRGLNPVRGLAWSQIALLPALLLAAFLLADVLPYSSPLPVTPVKALHALHVLRAIDVVLPATVLWGMSFPLALAAAGQSARRAATANETGAGHGDTGRTSGYVYAANTVGAIVGALAVSFLIIPMWGTKVAGQAIIVASALSAAVLFHAMRPVPGQAAPKTATGRSPAWLSPAWALAAGALCAALAPGLSTVFKAHGRYIWWVDPKDEYPYVSEGAASTVAVHIAPDGYRNFHVSGRVEATNNPNDLRTERLIGHLSALTHPKPESILVVGLGGGVSAGALTLYPEVKRIVICEIEPRVVGAANLFARENYSVLSDPRVEMVFDDARHFLATTPERFDIITSDPIHPWVRGNSILFSREYYGIVSSKLKPGGIASQWVPLYETTEKAIQIQMRTFTDAFPNGTVWNTAASGKGYDVVLVGGAQPMSLDLVAIQDRMNRTPRIGDSLREVRIASAVDLFATYATRGLEMERWLSGTPVNRDFSLKLEYISGLALNAKEANPIYAHMTAGRSYPKDLFVASPEMESALRSRITGDGAKSGK